MWRLIRFLDSSVLPIAFYVPCCRNIPLLFTQVTSLARRAYFYLRRSASNMRARYREASYAPRRLCVAPARKFCWYYCSSRKPYNLQGGTDLEGGYCLVFIALVLENMLEMRILESWKQLQDALFVAYLT
eukprot:Gb_15011 [translate_table: standard]